ncbi:MAG: hypothetical protein U0893_20550 [Chloroflexota bacterium]
MLSTRTSRDAGCQHLVGGRQRRSGGRLRGGGRWLPRAAAILVALVLGLAASGLTAPVVPRALASVMAAEASDYVPTAANLPPGYIEELSEPTGGDLNQMVALRRSFVTQDKTKRVIVDVSMAGSIAGAQTNLDDRVNQLVQYMGWTVNRDSGVGDVTFRASGLAPDGANSALIVFRVLAITGEVAVTNSAGPADLALLENVAKLVANRMQTSPDMAVGPAGFTTQPVKVPGKDLPGLPPGGGGLGTGSGNVPGSEVNGGSSGSPIQGDTVVTLNVTGLDRPWLPGATAVAPPTGLEYLSVEVQIDVNGPTEVTIALTDFAVNTFDGRNWTPVGGRTPVIQTGPVSVNRAARGWITFLLPTDQPALQLTWRLRTTQALSSQGNADQTMVVPLSMGAVAQASVGSSAPPNNSPVVPPTTGGSGTGSSGTGGSGTGGSGTGGSGSSGTGRPRGGSGLR